MQRLYIHFHQMSINRVIINSSPLIVLLKNRAARRCGQALGIITIETGGLLILAKRRGLIPTISPGIQALRDACLWLSDSLSRGIAIAHQL